jgi:hypothetical protein
LISSWCNSPINFHNNSLRDFVEYSNSKTMLAIMNEFESEHPDIAKKYFDLNFAKINNVYFK